jgi:CRISPR-associated protein Cas5h
MSSRSQVIVFDIWASFAYFRKPYTTTTALTFNFIPRSTIEGVIGAILGISYCDLFSRLANSKIGLGILAEIRKIPFSTMHTHSDFWQTMGEYIESRPTEKKKDFNARINMELLVNPKYRIYFSQPNGYQKKLEYMLKNHQTVFTPYLGTSTMIANFKYVNTFDCTLSNKQIANVSSIIPFSSEIPNMIVEKDKFYAIEQNIPGRINQSRELLSSYSALYSSEGQTIKVRNFEVNTFTYNDKEHDFVFLPS